MKHQKLLILFSFFFLGILGVQVSQKVLAVCPVANPSFTFQLPKQNVVIPSAEAVVDAAMDTDDNDMLADDSLDDDDSFSPRKKVSVEISTCFAPIQYNLNRCFNTLPSKCCYMNFYKLPTSHFISLRVFKL